MVCDTSSLKNNDDDSVTLFLKNGENIELRNMSCTKNIHNSDACIGIDKAGNKWKVFHMSYALD